MGQPLTASPPGYRADVDGLRALAVGGVVAFHYGLGPIGGGFAGVDVFFVISGALIAAVLRRTPPGAPFLAGFLERRLRRILPALLVVLAACAAGATTMLPNDLKAVGLGLMNAVVFDANHYFAGLAEDYFASGALAGDPVLHTWSLAVEAQFYLAFALLWGAGQRGPRIRPIVLGLLAAASLAASLVAVAVRPAAAFYLMPLRFWEFMAGAMLPRRLPGPLASSGVAAAAGAAGLGLIGLGFLLLTPATPFPGAAALPPVLGAALVLGAGARPNPVSRLLGARPLAALGRLSYTLYLWHWPVLVFAAYGHAGPLPLATRLGLLAVALLLAGLTSRLVERPLIARRWLARPRPFFLAMATGTLAVAAAGLAVNLAGQNIIVLTRLPPDVQRLAAGEHDVVRLRCPLGPGADPGCRFGAPDGEPSVALWGNSFARQWLPAIDAAARRHGVAGRALLVVRCPPLLDVSLAGLPGCAAFNRDALADLDAHPALRTVLLGGDWSRWAGQWPGLGRTIDALQARGRRVVLILSPPPVPYAVPRTLALAALRHAAPPPLLSEAAARADRQAERDAVTGLQVSGRPVTVIDPFPAFCDGRACAVAAEGRPLYYDERHVTRFGAMRATALFDPAFAEAGTAPVP